MYTLLNLPTVGRLGWCRLCCGAWVAFLLVSAIGYAQEPSLGRNVESLLALARAQSLDYAAALREAEGASARAAAAGALPDPRLRAELMDVTRGGRQSATVFPDRAGSARYLLMQELPWFGKRDLRQEIADLEARSAQARAGGTWAELAARIKTTYAQRYYLSQSEALTREMLELMTQLEQVARARYAGGLAAQQDVIRAQLEQSALKAELIGLETEQHHLHTRMNALLARPSTAPLAAPEGLRPLPPPARLAFETLEARVLTASPQLESEEARFQSAEKERELAYKNRYPDVTLGIAPSQFQGAVKQWDLMLEVNIPLQQSVRRAQEQEAEAALSAARARREAAANQVVADLGENLSALEGARRAEALARENLQPQAELTFRAALAGYEHGKVDFATLLEAQRQIRQARLTRIKALAEGQARLADVERILGGEL